MFMNLVNKQRSELPRNTFTWHPDVFLHTFDTSGPNNQLPLSSWPRIGRFVSHTFLTKEFIAYLDIGHMFLSVNGEQFFLNWSSTYNI